MKLSKTFTRLASIAAAGLVAAYSYPHVRSYTLFEDAYADLYEYRYANHQVTYPLAWLVARQRSLNEIGKFLPLEVLTRQSISAKDMEKSKLNPEDFIIKAQMRQIGFTLRP